jgi:hypothetical protein
LLERINMFKKGKYQHYKGGLYEVIDVAFHSETNEEMVIYKSLKNDSLWVRPLTMFYEKVNINNELKPRFKFLEQ